MRPDSGRRLLVMLTSALFAGTSLAIGLFVVAFLAADANSPAFFIAGLALLAAVNLGFLLGMRALRRVPADRD